MRHDKVCTHLYYSICKALGIETTDKRYTHMHKPVCEEREGCHSVVELSCTYRQRSYSK